MTKLSVGAIITNKAGQVLLVKRKDDESFMPSVWEIPGGGVDEGESTQTALFREIEEETGLLFKGRSWDLVGQCSYGEGDEETIQYNCHVAVNGWRPRIVLTEHSEYAWVSPEEDKLQEYLPPGDMILEVLLGWKRRQ